jgi:hypothetical protein
MSRMGALWLGRDRPVRVGMADLGMERVRVFTRLAPAIVLLALLVPLPVRAQVNIDQDKTPAHIFASDCAVCHKSAHGLANGRGSSALTGFLTEHYTSSRDEAAAMSAYVLASGGGIGTAVPVHGQKPEGARGRASAADSKPRQARPSVKPGEEPAASAKLRRPAGERGRPEGAEHSATAEPGRLGFEHKPPSERRPEAAVSRRHGGPKPAEPAAKPEDAIAGGAPSPAESAKPDASASAAAPSAGSAAVTAAPAEGEPAAAAPAPTDNIPD